MCVQTDADAEGCGVDGEQQEAVVVGDERRRETDEHEVCAEHGQTVDTGQVGDEPDHDPDQRVGHAQHEDQHGRLSAVQTHVQTAEVGQVDERHHVRDTAEEVGEGEHDEGRVGQQTPVKVATTLADRRRRRQLVVFDHFLERATKTQISLHKFRSRVGKVSCETGLDTKIFVSASIWTPKNVRLGRRRGQDFQLGRSDLASLGFDDLISFNITASLFCLTLSRQLAR